MEFELLDYSPYPGEYDEELFEVSQECFRLLIHTAGGNSWVAVVGKKADYWPMVKKWGASKIIISNGYGVLAIETSKRELLFSSKMENIADFLILEPEEHFIASDDFHLKRFNSQGGAEWSSDKIAFDGILLDDIDIYDQKLLGRLWQRDGWYEFSLDIQQNQITQGPFVSAEWDLVP
ncbi:MAG: hypothetical protein CMP10_03475 [Zetaproteobacteria bacterium]|nr:hypothetical protein [Pseudobdellovibrionaceae bacterium]